MTAETIEQTCRCGATFRWEGNSGAGWVRHESFLESHRVCHPPKVQRLPSRPRLHGAEAVRIPAEMIADVKPLAEAAGITVSKWIRQQIQAAIDHHEPTHRPADWSTP